MRSTKQGLFFVCISFIFALNTQGAKGRTLQELTRPVHVEVSDNPIFINLKFKIADKYKIYRKLFNQMAWGSPIYETDGYVTSWKDTTVSVGVLYEYMITGEKDNPNYSKTRPGNYLVYRGYVSAGINVDNTLYKGKVIVVIESGLKESLKKELHTFKMDLTGDGWEPVCLYVDKNENNIKLREKIQATYKTDPTSFKHIVLFGHIPIAYSGSRQRSPDGHGFGKPFPADCFYADIDGTWTDINDSLHYLKRNMANDGKFDQDTIPSAVEMGYGRIDMFDLKKVFPDKSELDLYKKYLEKEHKYRHADTSFRVGEKSVLRRSGHTGVNDNSRIGFTAIEAQSNIKEISIAEVRGGKDKPGKKGDEYKFFDADVKYCNENGPYLFYAKGSGVPSSTYIAKNGFNAFGLFGWQSFWGVWDSSNNPMRTLIASDGYGLICFWMLRASYPLHIMGSGKTIGDMIKRSINNNPIHSVGHHLYIRNFEPSDYDPSLEKVKKIINALPDKKLRQKSLSVKRENWAKEMKEGKESDLRWKGSDGHVIISLIGNPTLRLFPVIPPTNLKLYKKHESVELSWDRSKDESIIGYKIYRSSNEMGEYKLISDLIKCGDYIDKEKSEDRYYMLRAIKLQRTGSGTFFNPSQGIFGQI